jgi:hypothetical protein
MSSVKWWSVHVAFPRSAILTVIRSVASDPLDPDPALPPDVRVCNGGASTDMADVERGTSGDDDAGASPGLRPSRGACCESNDGPAAVVVGLESRLTFSRLSATSCFAFSASSAEATRGGFCCCEPSDLAASASLSSPLIRLMPKAQRSSAPLLGLAPKLLLGLGRGCEPVM